MLSLITVSICLFFTFLVGWTLTTYFVKKESQKLIRAALKNFLDVSRMFFASLKNLIAVLASNSLSYESSEAKFSEPNALDENEQTLSLIEPVQNAEGSSFEAPFQVEDDIALSSFSPEVVEVIREEEEKVA
tara:strand:+ start:359 stop:754 length:396 start_codon:yes stop_codon:yes gene_type:complete